MLMIDPDAACAAATLCGGNVRAQHFSPTPAATHAAQAGHAAGPPGAVPSRADVRRHPARGLCIRTEPARGKRRAREQAA